MKCPRCWTQKAYVRRIAGWKGVVLACLLLRPMRCHHCYHKFVVPWFMTWGRQVSPPRLRIAPASHPARPPHRLRRRLPLRRRGLAQEGLPDEGFSSRADAA
ncbi:MAG: hypothetical protein ACUVUC_03970 [Thermoguttaceae bacterium]